MAIVKIPTRIDLNVYDFTLELDDVVFTLSFVYNERSDHWYFSILDIDGNPLRQGIKLVSNFPLTTQWMERGRPQGEFIAANPENDDDPGQTSLGVDSVLCYDEGGAFG